MMDPRRSDSFSRVGIVGLGLMGGSLARSLKALPDPPTIQGLTLREEDGKRAMEEGILDGSAKEPGAFLANLDLLVYATPLGVTLDLLEEHRDLLTADTAVTDLVSLKVPVLEKVRGLGLPERYVGSHPMAGGEASGFGASRHDLFRGSKVWLVADGAPRDLVDRIQRFWASIGGACQRIDAWEHDHHMTWVSHLPQLASTALAEVLGQGGLTRGELGPGGLDMTRLAASNPSMWADLFRHAPATLDRALADTEKVVGDLRRLMAEGRFEEMESRMRRARAWSEGKAWK